jgi:uncharacterized protein YdcH (DUF465 family)
MKYIGCHFETIAAAHAPLDRDIKTTAALASNDSAAATMHKMDVERTTLPFRA